MPVLGRAPPGTAITTEPQSQTIASGQTASLSVAATGTPPLHYQWYQGASGTTTTPVGADSSSYTTPVLTTATSYWVRVSNTYGTADSITATISIGVAPTITTQPHSQTIASGQTANLSVIATGTPTLTYQWYQGPSGNTSIQIGGATSSNYTTPALSSTTSYWVRVSNTYGTADSATISIGVPFTDNILIAGTSTIRVVHITELRTRIAALRVRFELPAFSWTDPSLAAGTTIVRAQHVIDLRAALAGVYTKANLPLPAYTDPSLNAGTTMKVAHITQLRAAVIALE